MRLEGLLRFHTPHPSFEKLAAQAPQDEVSNAGAVKAFRQAPGHRVLQGHHHPSQASARYRRRGADRSHHRRPASGDISSMKAGSSLAEMMKLLDGRTRGLPSEDEPLG
jgi:hypothetical protein